MAWVVVGEGRESLSHDESTVLAVVAELARAKALWPGIQAVMVRTGLSRRRVQRAMVSLLDDGVVTRDGCAMCDGGVRLRVEL